MKVDGDEADESSSRIFFTRVPAESVSLIAASWIHAQFLTCRAALLHACCSYAWACYGRYFLVSYTL